jgi:hypothetical protein
MSDIVECYSGLEYAERPVAFVWQDERRSVCRICAQARTPEGNRFTVVDERGERFILSCDSHHQEWHVIPAIDIRSR